MDVIGGSLDALAARLESLAGTEARLHVANAVAGKLYELAVNDAAKHVDTGRMLSTLTFHVEPGEVGVTLQDYKVFVDGLELQRGIPSSWRPQLQEAGRAALAEVLGGGA